MSGSKPENNGSKIIQVRMKDTGTVLWEGDILQKKPLLLTTTFQELEIQVEEQTYTISILCVPNTIPRKAQEASNSTEIGYGDSLILDNFFDAISGSKSDNT